MENKEYLDGEQLTSDMREFVFNTPLDELFGKTEEIKGEQTMKLNSEQIIKALECCTDGTGICDNCPYFIDKSHDCTQMLSEALALILSYEQKIFELENRLKECENGYEGTLYLDRCKLHDAEEKNKELTEENATLHAAYTELTRTCTTLVDKVKVLNEQYDALHIRNAVLADAIENYQTEIMVTSGEVERLTVEVDDLRAIAEQYQRQFEDARANTVREIIATIKEKAESCDLYVANSHEPIDTIYQISKTQLDQIAQEMLEGNDGTL